MEDYFNPVVDLSHKVVGTSRRDDTDSLLVTQNLNLFLKNGVKGGHIIRFFGSATLERDGVLGRCRTSSPPVSCSTSTSLRPLKGLWCMSTSSISSNAVSSIVVIVNESQVAGTTSFAVEAYLFHSRALLWLSFDLKGF